MKPLIVSAPFGNYHGLLRRLTGTDDFTPTLGTFTAEARGFWTKPYGGRITRVLASVRYSPMLRSWRNKIGLKNPGVKWLRNQVKSGVIDPTDKIVSIYGWNMHEWDVLINTMISIRPMAIEINASCPNVDKPPFTDDLFKIAVGSGIKTIVKIPPVGYQRVMEMAYKSGVRCFHATNTLPTPKGGVSGKVLLPISLEVVKTIKRTYADIVVVGGGGVSTIDDVVAFRSCGATHVAIGSMLFNPLNWLKVAGFSSALECSDAINEALL